MFLFKTEAALQAFISERKSRKQRVAFVPTMGALHQGHIKLITEAKTKADIVVCSVFVNPTQFNTQEDLVHYPRTVAADMKLLNQNGLDILFLPSVEEVYPEGKEIKERIDLNGLDMEMEGPNRPGHFDGVVQVVKRFLEIVQPDVLVMGRKDFQQLAIIDHMLKVLDWQDQIKLIGVDTVREDHGLARSSRNERLDPDIRSQASVIYQTLSWAKENQNIYTIVELQEEAMKRLSNAPFRAEYFEIVDGHSLKPLNNMDESSYVVACTAVWADEVRLIDNIVLKQK